MNDHGPYTVSLDSRPQVALNDRSGCGGGYAKACEKLSGLKFFAGNLGEGEHTLRFENGGPTEGDRTFFGTSHWSGMRKERIILTIDFDRLIVTTPSVYPSRSLDSNSTCPWVDCGTNNTAASSSSSGPSGSSQSVSPSGSAPASTSSPNAATGAQPGSSVLLLTVGAWLLQRFL